MKKIYRNKKTADNEFTALTGIVAVSLEGGSRCLVVKQKTISKPTFKTDVAVSKAAYSLYHDTPLDDIKRVTHTCGVKNCVKREHLEAVLRKEAREGFDPARDGWSTS